MARSLLLFARVKTAISEWLRKRRKDDSRGQHSTQLTAVASVLDRIVTELDREQRDLANADIGTMYEACHRFDRRTVWLEQVWRYFQQRFDQRENAEQRAALAVADELVWSLYSAPIQKATDLGLRSGAAPAPVPFIDTQYSPAAFPSEVVPADLREENEAAGLLQDFLNRMPAPVVRMAPASVAAPWLVVYLAHEVGHHLQYDLLPRRALVASFQELVEAAVKRETQSAAEASKWGNWSREIFADVFSVVALGTTAVWAMGELVFTSASGMDQAQPAYPPAGMRLALLAETCDRLTGSRSGTAQLAGLFTPAPSPLRRAVLDAALGDLPDLNESLAEFCEADVPAFERQVSVWRDVFNDRAARDPAPALGNAPILTGAAVGQWQTLAAATPGDQLTAACKDLEGRYVAKVAAGAPDDGPRGSEEEQDVSHLAEGILDKIWQETR